MASRSLDQARPHTYLSFVADEREYRRVGIHRSVVERVPHMHGVVVAGTREAAIRQEVRRRQLEQRRDVVLVRGDGALQRNAPSETRACLSER